VPTYYYNFEGKLTDKGAAEIIIKSFPRGFKRIFAKKKCYFSVHSLCDALLIARIRCRSECTENCVKWAYEQINK
jgi:hypothetical protein